MQATAAAFVASNPPLKDPEQTLRCPRCDSANTKFCYYNNYNLSQPRHFCKDCRRYWTKGGCLRNIPVGGGTRKSSKRPSSASASAGNVKRPSPTSSAGEVQKSHFFSVPFPPIEDDRRWLDINGSFSSLLSSAPQFGSYLECYHSLDSLPILRNVTRPILEPDLLSSAESSGNNGSSLLTSAATSSSSPSLPENFLSLPGDATGWVGSWPDLSIYTPGTSFR